MSISYADMREIVAIEHKGESHKEGEDLDQFIDCMTKIRMEQHTKIEDKVESLLNQLVFPDEMIVKMSKALSPKKKKIKFNIKKVEEEEEDIREKISLWLSNSDCDDDFNTFVYFLVDECGVVLKQEEEEEEEEDPYLCEDCGKDFKWKSGTSSAGASVNDYHCGSCVEEEEEEEEDQCEVCDTKTKTTIKSYGCMDMSVCKNCEEEDDCGDNTAYCQEDECDNELDFTIKEVIRGASDTCDDCKVLL